LKATSHWFAQKHKLSPKKIAVACQRRREELQEEANIASYYADHNIQRGDEPLVLNVNAIDFSDAPEEMVEKLKEWSTTLIKKINKSISTPIRETIKDHRYLILNTSWIEPIDPIPTDDDDLLNSLLALKLDLQEAQVSGKELSFQKKERLEKYQLMEGSEPELKKWLKYILNKLVSAGAICFYREEQDYYHEYTYFFVQF
jgi:hypothetical protein